MTAVVIGGLFFAGWGVVVTHLLFLQMKINNSVFGIIQELDNKIAELERKV